MVQNKNLSEEITKDKLISILYPKDYEEIFVDDDGLPGHRFGKLIGLDPFYFVSMSYHYVDLSKTRKEEQEYFTELINKGLVYVD